MKKPRVEKIKITPELAKEWLKMNINNYRNANKDTVLFYADQMKRGQWMEDTNDLICFDFLGRLKNGQQRLMAIISSGVTLCLWVGFDFDPTSDLYMDLGRKRSVQDHFKGIANGNWIAAGVKGYLTLISGAQSHDGALHVRKISQEDIRNEYNRRTEFWQTSVNKSQHWYKRFSNVTPQYFVAYYAYFYNINPTDAEVFFDRLSGIEDHKREDPITELKLEIDKSAKDRTHRMNSSYLSAITIKAFKLFRGKKKIKKLKWDQGKENFPCAA